jgi:hypothetical protein
MVEAILKQWSMEKIRETIGQYVSEGDIKSIKDTINLSRKFDLGPEKNAFSNN